MIIDVCQLETRAIDITIAYFPSLVIRTNNKNSRVHLSLLVCSYIAKCSSISAH